MTAPSDVVVVGAGIVGCAVAYELARRGASVNIVDDRPAGMGATQAAAGVLAPYIEARHPGPLLDLTSRSLDLFDKFIARVSSVSGAPITYKRTGTVDVATRQTEVAALATVAKMLASRGIAADVVDRHALRDLEPHLGANALGGLLIPCHGFVGATELTKALVTAARRHGAQLIEQGRVLRIAREGADLKVDTARGSLVGNAVVIAAGSWAGQIEIEGAARAPVSPIRGQILQLGWKGAPLRRVTWGERCYFVPWDDGAVLVGATVEDAGFDERTTVAGVRELIEAASDLVPDAVKAGFQAARVGLRPATPDQLPIIGPSSVMPNVMYATGHYRNGVLLSPLTAKIVADSMLEGVVDPLLELTRPERFGKL